MFQQGLPTPLQSGINPYPGTAVLVLSAREEKNNASVTFNEEILSIIEIDGEIDQVCFAWDASAKVLLIAGCHDDPMVKGYKLPKRKFQGSLKYHNKELYTSLKGVFGIKDADAGILEVSTEPFNTGDFYTDPSNIPVWMTDRNWYVVKQLNS